MRIGCIYPGTFIHFIRIPSQKDPFIFLYEPLSNPSTKRISMLTALCRFLVIYHIWSSDEWMVQGFLHFFGRMGCHAILDIDIVDICRYLDEVCWMIVFFHVFSFHGLYWTGISRISTALVNAEFGLQGCGRFWVWIVLIQIHYFVFNHHHIYHWLVIIWLIYPIYSHKIIPDIIRWVSYLS